MTDKYLLSLWRTAVLKWWNHRCGFQPCTVVGDEYLECHHIIKRRVRVTRYKIRNGIPLCPAHHKEAHTRQGQARIDKIIGEKIAGLLNYAERITLNEYLTSAGMSRKEWLEETADTLKGYIKTGQSPRGERANKPEKGTP